MTRRRSPQQRCSPPSASSSGLLTSPEYLAPLVELARSQRRLVVATLNYDNCVELQAAHDGVPCNVGVSAQHNDRGTLDLDGDGVALLKLHGSIDWMSSEQPLPPAESNPNFPTAPFYDRVPMPLVMRVPRPEPYWKPAVIFGGQNKLTAAWPFFDLFRVFQAELSEAERLTVVGYSFRDEHVNQCISQWLNRGHRDARLRILDPGFQASEAEYAQTLRRVLPRGRLQVVEKTAKDGLREVLSS